MAESAEELYARVVAAVGEGGRVPMSPVQEWGGYFPWEVVDGELVPKVLQPPADEEPRHGEDPATCNCQDWDRSRWIWENDRWFLSRGDKPTGLPLVLWLHPKEHYDIADLPDDLAAEQGRLSTWLARIIEHLDNVGRVHVCRFGDGGAHLHWWFIARPARLPNIIGSMSVEWDEMLPPGPEEVWREDWTTVAHKLANHDGRSLV